jgi:hypothetical protein
VSAGTTRTNGRSTHGSVPVVHERRQLVDLLTRIADHWYELRAHQP